MQHAGVPALPKARRRRPQQDKKGRPALMFFVKIPVFMYRRLEHLKKLLA